MKENNNGNDTNVGSIENSIEEAIERLEYIDRTYSCNNYYSIWDLKCIEILLSDYKRELKENEYMHNELDKQQTKINKYAKENEELKRLHIQDNKHLDFIMEHSIPVQKVKDKIENLQNEKEEYYSQYKIEELNDKIQVLQELLEGRK